MGKGRGKGKDRRRGDRGGVATGEGREELNGRREGREGRRKGWEGRRRERKGKRKSFLKVGAYGYNNFVCTSGCAPCQDELNDTKKSIGPKISLVTFCQSTALQCK